jgi:hypothetical protein
MGKILEASAVVLILFASFIALSAFGKAPAPAQYHAPAEIYPQGSGSGLDADTVDGKHASELGGSASGILTLVGQAPPPLSSPNQAVIYLDNATKDIKVSIDGQPYVNLISGATAPSQVTLSVAAGVANITLSWPVPGNGGRAITGYRIYKGATSGGETYFTTTSSTSYTDAGLPNGATYYYKVSAVNAIGEGTLSNEASATTVISCYCDSDGDGRFAKTAAFVPVSACSSAIAVVGYACQGTAGDDCNDGCSTCYPGSTAATSWTDGLDQDCNGVIDNRKAGGAGCDFTSANYPIGYSPASNNCRSYCGSIGYNFDSMDCLTGRGPANSQSWNPGYPGGLYYDGFDFSTCTRSNLISAGGADSCLYIPMPTNLLRLQCNCYAYQ